MRIAFSGSHRTGKSTLIQELSKHLPEYATVDEPYRLMEEEGHEFSHPPSVADFEAQLERSIDEAMRHGSDVLFDRSPLDFLAYISVHEDAAWVNLDEWLPRVRNAIHTLDLIVLVPVEKKDRVALFEGEDEGSWRTAMDDSLRAILFEDSYDVGVEVLEVQGGIEKRTRMVLQRIRRSL